MATELSSSEWLKQDLGALIDALELTPLQKRFLRARWLDQLAWLETAAQKAQRFHYVLRLTTIVGGVMIPALVGLNFDTVLGDVVRGATFAIGLLVALSAAVEEFFHFGERWRHYRRSAELLKIEGWQFFQLSGAYQAHGTHAAAYAAFAACVEDTIRHEVDAYVTQVVREAPQEKK